MSLEDAEIDRSPTSTVEHHQLVKLFCPNERFLNFIQAIEANFMENLTVEMMIAYDDESLIEVICTLKENINIYNQFTSLFDDIDEYSTQIVKDIFDFVFLRFKRMRGRWFINSMRVKHGGKSKNVDDFSTRSLSKARAAISSTILKESSIFTSSSTTTINQNNNFEPSENPYISTISEDDSSNSHVDESSLHDSDIDLEN